MTNKERQAKLQYLLNSLSMTKEQKDIVVDLVNSSGGGAPFKDVIAIKTNEEGNNLVVFRNDIEIASFNNKVVFDEQSNISYYTSNEMFDFFNSVFDNDIVISSEIDNGQAICNNVTKIKSDAAVGFSFIGLNNYIIGFVFKKEE